MACALLGFRSDKNKTSNTCYYKDHFLIHLKFLFQLEMHKNSVIPARIF